MHLNPAAPVLALPDARVQVGWNDPLVLDGVTDAQARFLRSLEGGRRIGPAEHRRHAEVLAQLGARGLLEHDSTDGDQPCVRIYGAGAVGTEAAIALARAGVALTVVDRARARAGAAAHLPEPDCGAVAHARVRDAVPHAQLRGAHADASLDVLISAGPAVVRARELLVANRPHLLVECGDREVRVGPLVIPGITACATCLGLSQTQARADWPVLAIQCDSRRPRVRPVHATMAGAMVAHEVLAFVANRAATTWRVGEAGVSTLPATPAHPDCGCTAPAGTVPVDPAGIWGA